MTVAGEKSQGHTGDTIPISKTKSGHVPVFPSHVPKFSRLAPLLAFLINLKHGLYVRRERYHVPKGPHHLHVEATNACNLSCPFCARTTTMKRKIGTLDPDLFRKIAKDAVAAGVRTCHFAVFGEPLLHPRIHDLVRIGKQAGLQKVWISSNGSFLTMDKVEKLAAAGLDELHVCVDGSDAQTHEALRKGSCYETVFGQLRDCADYLRKNPQRAFRMHVQMVVMKQNREQRREFRRLWKQVLRGVPHRRLFLKPYTSFASQTDFGGSGRRKGDFRFRVPCFRLAEEIAILWDGTVSACCYDADGKMPVGDIRKDSLATVWKDQPMENLRILHAKDDLASLGLCQNCDVVNRVWNPKEYAALKRP